MIPASKPELCRLQSEAVALANNAGLNAHRLLIADDVTDARRETGRLLDHLHAARSVAMKVDAFGKVFEITEPARAALEALWLATTDEINAGLEAERANG